MQQGKYCEICSEFSGQTDNTFRQLFDDQELPSRAIAETEHFVVSPGIGSITTGYVLVWTRKHLFSMSQLTHSQISELASIIEAIRQTITANTGLQVALFEHGAGPNMEASCGACIEHAHIHLCPSPIRLNPLMNLDLVKEKRISEIHQLLEFSSQPYLFVQDVDSTLRVFENIHLPSQYMRRVWANALDMETRWHWALFPFKENMLRTLRMFSDFELG